MIKNIAIFLVLISSQIHAEEQIGFHGCGEYVLKGELVKDKINPVVYKTNIGTKSEMSFSIENSDDLILISGYMNKPTEISASISKLMNGTRGEINHISKLALRRNNPLDPLIDSGIFLITPKSCK
jgi:hypothetical protein